MDKINSETINEIIIKQLNWRYAVKKFDPTKKISAKDWSTLEECLRLAPSTMGLQPWKFIIVMNPNIRKKLTPASHGQQQIENCSHLVVVTHLKEVTEDYIDKHIHVIAKTRGVPTATIKGYRDMIISSTQGNKPELNRAWMARQAYIPMGMYMAAAALLQVDVCPMEGFDPIQYDEILNLNNTPYTSVALLATGYRAVDDQYQNLKKARFDKAEVIEVI